MVTFEDSSTKLPDFYTLLDVARDASIEEIKKSYRRKAMECHPDKTRGDKEKEDIFKSLTNAYQTLSDPVKRKQYDAAGSDVILSEFPPFSMDSFVFSDVDALLKDLFQDLMTTSTSFANVMSEPLPEPRFGGNATFMMFGGMPMPSPPPPMTTPKDPPAPTTEVLDVSITSLTELYHGSSKMMEYTIEGACRLCSERRTNQRNQLKCVSCFGAGQMSGLICTSCHGQGVHMKAFAQCTECHGNFLVERLRYLSVNVPKGVPDGHKMLIREKGSWNEQKQNYDDIVVMFHHELGDALSVDLHNNVRIALSIPFVDAVCGFRKQLHLYGVHEPPITIASNTFLDPSLPITLHGKGLPKFKANKPNKPVKYGDLILDIRINYPEKRTMAKLQPIFMKLFKREFITINDDDIVLTPA
jgi:DnaJ-class molecular chaperone